MGSRAQPARFPPFGAWPAVMRADMAAAYFDCRDTLELARQVQQGEAPPPTSIRGKGRAKEPVWAREACERFLARRHQILERDRSDEDVSALI